MTPPPKKANAASSNSRNPKIKPRTAALHVKTTNNETMKQNCYHNNVIPPQLDKSVLS